MILEHIISTIAPFSCLGCHREDTILCNECQAALPVVDSQCAQPGLAYMAATTYTNVAKDVVHALKFERAQAAADCIAKVMASRIALPNNMQLVVTHVPTANVRVRQRGYDQAQQIARKFAQHTKLPYVPLLARKNDARQVGSSKQARASQAAGMFRVKQRSHLPNTAVLLIDDVITTGATMQAAAHVLTEAGATHVYPIAFACVE
jgi:ComF family protein